MAYKDIVLNDTKGKIVIDNFITTLKVTCERLSKSGRDNVGILYESRGLFSRINDLIDEFGYGIVGTALEIKRRGLVIIDPGLYYEASNTAWGSVIDEEQEEWVQDLLYDLTEMANEIYEELESERSEEKQEKPKPTAEELKKQYQRELKNLKSLISRRQKFGLSMFDISIPKMPKKITAGSIRRLQKVSAKVKSKYRYLGGGRYKGMRK